MKPDCDNKNNNESKKDTTEKMDVDVSDISDKKENICNFNSGDKEGEQKANGGTTDIEEDKQTKEEKLQVSFEIFFETATSFVVY